MKEKLKPRPDFQAGMRITFLRDLEEPASCEHPAYLFARKGEGGRITRVGGCTEGYWVKWDGWPSAAFGCESKDFTKKLYGTGGGK